MGKIFARTRILFAPSVASSSEPAPFLFLSFSIIRADELRRRATSPVDGCSRYREKYFCKAAPKRKFKTLSREYHSRGKYTITRLNYFKFNNIVHIIKLHFAHDEILFRDQFPPLIGKSRSFVTHTHIHACTWKFSFARTEDVCLCVCARERIDIKKFSACDSDGITVRIKLGPAI